MIDPLRLASIGAFVATGLCLISFLMLVSACLMVVTMPGPGNLGDRIALVYLLGTVAGLCLGYAQWEYGNLRHARSGAG